MKEPADDPSDRTQREVERLWRDLVYHRLPGSHFSEQPWSPPADVVVGRDYARVILELAGVPRESVRVRLTGSVLEVSGRRQGPQEPASEHYHRAEIYFGEFSRTIELPWEADPDKVEALYRDGMLEIRIRTAVRSARRADVTIQGR
ncbi:MAG: Hsp20/alpha crystallin family protein [Candidatus Eisenbacteria bacterium]|uniref:Hsp20/alpha crystallin family protein n=1 Tax=Eiseniibacteriota bacterium TaxID=2212470 RepID=A0A849SFX1_UNCEI|nr:Hsp20/alpha crystallin family protein [Candidatus Eisenbacteria bacterium]